MPRPWNDVCGQSSAATSASFISTQSPYDPIINTGHRQHEKHVSNTAEIAQWTNSITAPFTGIHPPMLPYDDQNNSIQYRSQVYSELYGSTHTTVPTFATGTASGGHSIDAVYASNRNPNPYEEQNTQFTQTPYSTTSMDFDSMTSHIHGYRQPSRIHGQDLTYGTENPTLSAQGPPIHPKNQTTPSYEEGSTSQDHDGSQTFH